MTIWFWLPRARARTKTLPNTRSCCPCRLRDWRVFDAIREPDARARGTPLPRLRVGLLLCNGRLPHGTWRSIVDQNSPPRPKENIMRTSWSLAIIAAIAVGLCAPALSDAACCYFSAKNADILQPAQKVFISWDPVKKIETFTVQPKFEGNALDFGMVIPTPSQPKLHEMPRDFFKHLAVYTILKKRESPHSKLLPFPGGDFDFANGTFWFGLTERAQVKRESALGTRPPTVVVLEAGVVGSLDYKVISAGRADDLYQWLKDHKYHYAGDEATLNFYVQKKWLFTVMKIDTMQMKRNKDGSFSGEVTPTRFQFASERLIYPLKITQISVKDKTEALFYVQAPHKVDLEGDMSYQRTWVPMLQAATGCTPGGIQGGGEQWLKAINDQIPGILARNRDLGFTWQSGQRPQPDQKGHIATTMEWARKLTAEDLKVLRGEAPYSERVPNVDEGFTEADMKDAQK